VARPARRRDRRRSFWHKLKLEESVMRRQFGDAYARYAERVPALIPFVL
jgi:protein-S-isoprenylcysteine O-methyltransferase Ste14